MGEAGWRGWAVWTRPQRAVVGGMLIVLLGVWGYRAARDRMILPAELSGAGPRAGELDDRVDPNTATAAELATLPGIGQQTARDIVAYREQFKADGRGVRAFENETDLLKVKGVGAGTASELAGHLRFPTSRP